MKIPKKIKVGAFDYSIIVTDINKHRVNNDSYLYGYADHREKTIYIDSGVVSGQEFEEILFHEIHECIKYVYAEEYPLDHAMITQLAVGWLQVLKDNGFLKEK